MTPFTSALNAWTEPLTGSPYNNPVRFQRPWSWRVSAWAESNGLVLGQLKVEDKSNEITAVPELLRALELAGCIVTLDAMGCQKKIAREIQENAWTYVPHLYFGQWTQPAAHRTNIKGMLPMAEMVAKAGKHVYTVHSEAKDVLNLEVEPGETYYVLGAISVGVFAGHPNLSPSSKEAFDAMKDKLKDNTGQDLDPPDAKDKGKKK